MGVLENVMELLVVLLWCEKEKCWTQEGGVSNQRLKLGQTIASPFLNQRRVLLVYVQQKIGA